MTEVAAVVIDGRGRSNSHDQFPELPEAVDERLFAPVGALRDAAGRAAAPLIWLLDASVRPSAATLSALLAVQPGPAVSLPLGPDGRPIEALMGGFADLNVQTLLEQVGDRKLPVRHVPILSMLVEREHVLAAAPPDERRYGPYAGVEWTARIFARHGGVMVPASTVEVVDEPRFGDPVAAVRIVRSGAWRWTDAVRPVRLGVNRLLESRRRH